MKLTREQEIEWLAAMTELEGERGPLFPSGSAGGVVAKARREKAAREGGPPMPIATTRSRGRVRWSFGAIEKPSRRAA
jgi:hypothetical protein